MDLPFPPTEIALPGLSTSSPSHTSLPPRLGVLLQSITDSTTFWQHITALGTPLRDPSPTNPHHTIVTFLWRSSAADMPPHLSSPAWSAPSPLAPPPFQQIPQTDIWLSSAPFPSDAISSYTFLAPSPLSSVNTTTVDPFNPCQISTPADPADPTSLPTTSSYFVLPDAPSTPWLLPIPSPPRGLLTPYILNSPRLSPANRRLWVYTPNQPPSSTSPRLFLFLQGWTYLYALAAPQTLDYLVDQHHFGPIIAAFLDSPPSACAELTGDPRYAAFLIQELLPWMSAHYSIDADPRHITIAGFGHGAFAALYTALSYPTTVGRLILQSAFITHPSPTRSEDSEPEWLARRFAAAPRHFLQCVISVGRWECEQDSSHTSTLTANRHLRDVLRARNHDVIYHEYSGGHDPAPWRAELSLALQALHPPTSAKLHIPHSSH